tara:strand:+ start:227 stop:439 length:213 start_codon:yes stop_codon:yes gene_type:complete
VIIADGQAYHQGTLLEITNGMARIQSQAIVRQGPLRVFPLHSEQDGLYELQGEFLKQENLIIWLTLNDAS